MQRLIKKERDLSLDALFLNAARVQYAASMSRISAIYSRTRVIAENKLFLKWS